MITKPTFGVKAPETKKEEELGAIWDNSGSMNIRFKLPKSKLLKIIEDSKTDSDGNLLVGFTATRNESHNGVDSRPLFRIFERNGGVKLSSTPSVKSQS